MSTEVEDILKNAQTTAAAAAKQSMFAKDVENMSLLEDNRNSFATAMDDLQRGTSERKRRAIKSAKDFLESDAFKMITNDKVTVNGNREKLSLMCSTLQHRALTCAEDRALLHGRICAIDLALLCSGSYLMNDVFERNLKNVVQAKWNTTWELNGVGPPMHVCLAWLCHAAQCKVSDVVPGGKIFPDAERYIYERLQQNGLPVVDENERPILAIYQLSRVLYLLAVCDLRTLSPADRSILIFVICRLLLDKNSCSAIQSKASLAIGNILNASSLTKRATLIEFSNIFPLISDDLLNLNLCHQCVRLSIVDPSCCLRLLSSFLIHLSKRAEREPTDLENVSEEVFVNAYLGVVIDVVKDVIEVYNSESKQKCVIITMFVSSLHPSLLDMVSIERKEQLKGLFQRLKQDLGTSTCPDGALCYRLLENLMIISNFSSTEK